MFNMIPYEARRLSYNPFRELENLEREVFGDGRLGAFKTDITDMGESYLLEADLPGFKKEDIRIELDDKLMTIRAERHSEYEKKDKKGNYLRCERSYGSYARSFDVSSIDAEGIRAEYADGVLKLTMPKKEKKLPTARRLEIQ